MLYTGLLLLCGPAKVKNPLLDAAPQCAVGQGLSKVVADACHGLDLSLPPGLVNVVRRVHNGIDRVVYLTLHPRTSIVPDEIFTIFQSSSQAASARLALCREARNAGVTGVDNGGKLRVEELSHVQVPEFCYGLVRGFADKFDADDNSEV